MRLIALLHRWAGGLIGFLLAVLGLSGALLVWKDEWLHLTLPSSRGPTDMSPSKLVAGVQHIVDSSDVPLSFIVLPTKDLSLFTVRTKLGGGFYTDINGNSIARWDSSWERLELWLFDLHHSLLLGAPGELVSGISGMIGLGFLVTGGVLWWRTRRAFVIPIWPKRFSRTGIIRHHRDLGIVFAPLLFVAMATGVLMTLRPVSVLVFSIWSSPAEMRSATRPPQQTGGATAELDWGRIVDGAISRFPEGEIRIIRLPAKEGDLIALRMRQPYEWLPNGRTLLWFDPQTGNLIEAREASNHPRGLQFSSSVYPLHAAKVGGLAYKVSLFLTGFALAMLGSFTVWTFWKRQGAAISRLRNKPERASSCDALEGQGCPD